jgi:hypothetical protein
LKPKSSAASVGIGKMPFGELRSFARTSSGTRGMDSLEQ